LNSPLRRLNTEVFITHFVTTLRTKEEVERQREERRRLFRLLPGS
jgi:hypothetical protein